MTQKEIYVVKRSGEKEPLDYDKINKVLIWATEDINGVSASDIAMSSELEIFNGITTEEIHEVLIKTTANMITEDTPNYQYVAAKLKNYLLRKRVFNTYDKFPRLKTLIKENINRGVYDPILLEAYDEYEIDKIENYIKHHRDEELTYAGISQLMDKYLLVDRTTGEHFETPQFMYMLIPMTIFANIEDKNRRRKLIKTAYDYISTHVISLPTPILGGVRTPNRQYSSCTLIDIDDTLNSIDAGETAVSKYISKRAGIGLNSRIRAIGAKVKNGEVEHTGIIPFIKRFEAAVKSCSQGGIRGGAATIYYPFWHYEVEDLLVLKNNAGNELNRARRMDHAFQFSRLFYKRFLANEDITLFSPDEVPDLYEAFGYDNDLFDELYEKYERSRKTRKRKINARDYMNLLVKERIETGRIYIMNIDNANDHSAFTDKINMSNLCLAPDSKLKIRIEDFDGFSDTPISKEFTKNEDGLFYAELDIEVVNSLFNKIYIDSVSIKDVDNEIIMMNSLSLIEVLSYNLETNVKEYKPILKSALTNESAELYKITDEETGKFIECTADHLIYTENRGYVKACELNEDDLLSFE